MKDYNDIDNIIYLTLINDNDTTKSTRSIFKATWPSGTWLTIAELKEANNVLLKGLYYEY